MGYLCRVARLFFLLALVFPTVARASEPGDANEESNAQKATEAPSEPPRPNSRCRNGRRCQSNVLPFFENDTHFVDLQLNSGKAHSLTLGYSFVQSQGPIFWGLGLDAGIAGASFADGFFEL